MKLKGIKPVEQHIEKVVIGVAGAAGLGLLGIQFFTPSTVEVNKVQISVADAFRPAVEAAERAKASMENADPKMPEAPAANASGKGMLAIGLAAGSGVKSSRVALGSSPNFGKTVADHSVATAGYQMPVITAPSGIVGYAFRSTVSPVEALNNPELAKMLPPVQPLDKASVTLEARFNGQSLREQLTVDPDGEAGPLQPIPLGWWRDPSNDALAMVEIVGVEVERETLRLPDGTTPPSPVIDKVPGIPGRIDGLKAWNQNVKSLGDVPPLIDQYRAEAEEIQRPPYLSTIAGPAWRPASEMSSAASPDGDAKSRKLADARKRLADLDGKIAELEQKIASAPAADPRDKPRQQETRPAEGGGGRGGGGGKGGGNVAPPSSTPKSTEPQVNKAALERQLAARNEERKKLAKTLEEMGEVVQTADGMPAPVAMAAPLLDNANVKLYAHDLTVVPGAEYRYRMRVVVNNPLYGRNLQESQRTLADQSLISGQWSDWTQAIDVDPNEFFVVTSAEPRSELNPSPKASAEMYVFYYGYYRVAGVSLEPGDVLSGTARLPDLKVADMKKLEELLKNPSEAISAPVAPPPMPGGKGGGGGGGKGGGARPPQPTRDERPVAQAPAAGPAGTEWLSVPAKKMLELKVDAVFLDAIPAAVGAQGLAGEERPRYLAMMRDQHGHLLHRSPDAERAADIYKRLEASAKEGERQGAAEVKPEEVRIRPPKKERAPTPGQPAKSGGGSGG